MVTDGLESITKTKAAVQALKKFGLEQELTRVIESRRIRPGKGKARNRKYKIRRGPMIIYKEDNGIQRACRNIPGVATMSVDRMYLLKLAPGGVFGRLIIWTESAFKHLNEIYGTKLGKECPLKKKFKIPRALMENADLARIINSGEVQSALRPKIEPPKSMGVKRNPLKDAKLMEKLNPGATYRRMLRKRALTKGTAEHAIVQKKKAARLEAAKKFKKEHKTGPNTFYKKLLRAFATKKKEEEEEKEEEAED